MATLAEPAPIRLSGERKFFGAMALIMVAATFVGFAPSSYLAPAFGGKPLSLLLHVHGVVFTLWMLLYLAQTGLISARRTDIHRSHRRAITANLHVRKVCCCRAVDVSRRVGPGEDDVVSALSSREVFYRFWNSNKRGKRIAGFAAAGKN